MTSEVSKALSIIDLQAMKSKGEKITCLTAYDASFSAIIDKVGIDIILVGDSLGMVVQGKSTTLPVTVGDIVYHCQNVNRGRQRAYLIADMPFMSYYTLDVTARTAARLLQQGGAQMVKLEGGKFDCIEFLVKQSIPVCGHLGLTPQSIHQLGSYRVQGRDEQARKQLFFDAKKLQDIGASLLVLECVPASLAKEISQALTIPVIGIGAGVDCDGQVLVLYDMLNIGIIKRPRFSKDFLSGCDGVESAIRKYQHAVKSCQFPGIEHSY